MVLGYVTQPQLLTMIAAWIGLFVSFYTIQTFNLRQWKIAAYYFLTGLIAFILYATIELFRLFLNETPSLFFQYIGYTFKAFAILFITAGVYKVWRTANTVGA
jgi:hypothetical protein